MTFWEYIAAISYIGGILAVIAVPLLLILREHIRYDRKQVEKEIKEEVEKELVGRWRAQQRPEAWEYWDWGEEDSETGEKQKKNLRKVQGVAIYLTCSGSYRTSKSSPVGFVPYDEKDFDEELHKLTIKAGERLTSLRAVEEELAV